ncbi:MAG: acetyl/propionyl/methylcrotonyl-CoA carboxylase subunit alpha [Pseudomonadota bacterium]
MFNKILIANRGEIACRVITTAKRLGTRTVAIYSDADAGARHVAMADEAVPIGGSAVAESYLRVDRIIDAAKKTGAQAIHPGYGFLSENPDFVDAVEAAGLVFVGPPADAIRAMGLKDAAKALMTEAGVPVVPGYHGDRQEPDFLADEAERISYPVLIKARAGGGGKGMRLVESPGEFHAALEGAKREAEASFGDPICLIEKFVTQPRHIEIQIFGDSHGNVVHLFERDCSLQRRHQKVIEEAPAPDMPDSVRAAMGAAAVNAAKAIGYRSAGTVEFIVDGSGPLREDGFWFMEMNTRLQVEHPVSEAITGLDFVELQLKVAAGDPLPFRQDDLSIDGWSFEARLYAEDVPKGFLPATGRLDHLSFPAGVEFVPGSVRVDSGVRQGDDISPWYDPMIAKVIVHGPTRASALNKLTAALADCHLTGCVTNLAFLGALSRHAGFAAGKVDTGLIGRDLDALAASVDTPPHVMALAALGALELLNAPSSEDPWDALTCWRQWTDAEFFTTLQVGDERYECRVTALGKGQYEVDSPGDDESAVRLTVLSVDNGTCTILHDDIRSRATVKTEASRVAVFVDGCGIAFDRPDALADTDADESDGDSIRAPMPGLVRVVHVEAGARVASGDPLIVLEAMKMEHSLTAPCNGIVSEVLAAVDDQVSNGALLVSLEPESA